MSAPHLMLPGNVAFMAGAGAGKTHNLLVLSLHLLGGATRRGEPLPCPQLCAVTFTEKAAAEMKRRLREWLQLLATEQRPQIDERLYASYAELSRPFPDRLFWARVRDELPNAFIGTFHSLCAQILRRSPAEAGLDPAFELLDESAAAELLDRAAQMQVLADLEAGGIEEAQARKLCAHFGLRGAGPRVPGLLGLLATVYRRMVEEGREPSELAAVRLDPAETEAAFDRVVEQARTSCAEAGRLDGNQNTLRYAASAASVLPVLQELKAEDFRERALQLSRAAAGIALTCEKKAKPALKAAKEALGALEKAWAEVEAIPLQRAFAGMLARVARAYEEDKRRRRALDFTDLLVKARNLLRDHPQLRREVQERVGVLLVDEFQDTNSLQLDLVSCLCEQREGGPRPVKAGQSAFEALPPEPGMLCAVGDLKQSIYEFRGADVEVFSSLAARIQGEPSGQLVHLRENRRSQPGLIAFFNRLFSVAMGGEASDGYWVRYHPAEDDLQPVRPPMGERHCAEILSVSREDSEQRRPAEAQAVAKRIAWLLSEAAPALVFDGDGKTPRRPRGADIAILFRRFSHLDTFRAALLARSIPHVVVRGRGFYEAQEVLDLASLLTSLEDASDGIASAAVLRSPLVGLSDASLLRLKIAQGRLSLAPWLAAGVELPAELQPDERERLERFLTLFRRLARELDRLGAAGCLKAALDELDYCAVVAAGFQGEQKVANVQKLLEMARAWDRQGIGSAGRFARRLEELARLEPTEGHASLMEEGDPRAVRLMTVHQAKGLEFPIVFVPECGAALKREHAPVLFDRSEGLGVKPRGPGGSPIPTADYARVSNRKFDRAQAESLRLFYVAATRARDLLVFSGELPERGGKCWRQVLEEVAGDATMAGLVRKLSEGELEEPVRTEEAAVASGPSEAERAAAQASLRRALERPMPRVRSLVAPVTQLADFESCPRRYLYGRLIGLEEHPRSQPIEVEAAEGEGMDALARGTLAHRLLEQVDLKLQEKELGAQLEAIASEAGAEVGAPEVKELITRVQGFALSPFGQKLAALPATQIYRELPFVLALGDEHFALHLKGQIDLLAIDEDGSALVLDYKNVRSQGRGADDYRFQLQCYALAARSFLPAEQTIKTGIVFLQDSSPEPKLRTVDPEELRAFSKKLVGLGRQLLERRVTHAWPGLERAKCEALRCGYLHRCHRALKSA